MALADPAIDLKWADLIPGASGSNRTSPLGVLRHGTAAPQITGPDATRVRHDLDGTQVRLPGYIVPVDYSGIELVGFLLVPYIGACVHIPPPPVNQLIYVTTETPYRLETMWEAVKVTGRLTATDTTTELAEAGYTMAALSIIPYA